MELAAFCALNGMDSLLPLIYQGDETDLVWVETVVSRVEQALHERRAQ